ncbi:MAG TPA: hypothetical protein VH054_29035, partial [Polyangiaceae bacterium]|nr:hypothetical protein [Polyangiaceae bacterium]
ASGPPITDLQTWMAAHVDAIVVSTNPLGSYFDTDAAPLNIDVDPRTMQFLDTTLGFDTNLEQTLETLLASMK